VPRAFGESLRFPFPAAPVQIVVKKCDPRSNAFRDLASHAPYELVEIVANSHTYGGGGIFNLYGTVAADSRWAPYIFVHEFAHHLAGLADEYFTSPTAYEKQADRSEPWERNVTADPHHPKWAALLTAGVPLPTPWNEDGFLEWQKGVAGAAPPDPIRAQAGIGDGRAFRCREGGGHAPAVGRAVRGQGGGLRGRGLRIDRVFPLADGLHHVHARRRTLLRRLPRRHRPHSRPLRASQSARPRIRARSTTEALKRPARC